MQFTLEQQQVRQHAQEQQRSKQFLETGETVHEQIIDRPRFVAKYSSSHFDGNEDEAGKFYNKLFGHFSNERSVDLMYMTSKTPKYESKFNIFENTKDCLDFRQRKQVHEDLLIMVEKPPPPPLTTNRKDLDAYNQRLEAYNQRKEGYFSNGQNGIAELNAIPLSQYELYHLRPSSDLPQLIEETPENKLQLDRLKQAIKDQLIDCSVQKYLYVHDAHFPGAFTDAKKTNRDISVFQAAQTLGVLEKSGENPVARYLTEAACDCILAHKDQFEHGLDLNHLPAGFYLDQNPGNDFSLELINYNPDLAAELLTLQDANSPYALSRLALDLNSEPNEEIPPALLATYSPLQKDLVNKFLPLCQHGAKRYCTSRNLFDALTQFMAHLDDKQMRLLLQQELPPGNPIILLSNWTAVMANPHLKPEDKSIQFEEILNLPLSFFDGPIRAILDYQNSLRPCTFITRDMSFNDENFLRSANRQKRGFRDFTGKLEPTALALHENIQDEASFWRYLSYQPHKHSIAFYRQALKKINGLNYVTVIPGATDQAQQEEFHLNKIFLLRTLALSTTADNYLAGQEEQDLDYWNGICDRVISPSKTKEGSWAYICGLHTFSSSLRFLSQLAKTYTPKESGDNNPDSQWDNFSTCAEYLNLGAKFHATRIDDNLRTQLRLANFLNNRIGKYGIQRNGYLNNFKFLHAYTSTFNLNSSNLTKIRAKISTDESRDENLDIIIDDDSNILSYALKFFEDVLIPLSPEDLIAIMEKIISIRKSGYEYEYLKPLPERYKREIIDFLSEKYSGFFESGYFEGVKEDLESNSNLTRQQLKKITELGLSPKDEKTWIAIQYHLRDESINYTQKINFDKLNLLMTCLKKNIPADDFSMFLEMLLSMKEQFAPDATEVQKLFCLLINEKSIMAVRQMYFCQLALSPTVEPAKQDLIAKMNFFIEKLRMLEPNPPPSLINPVQLQEMLAKQVLVVTQRNLTDEFLGNMQKIVNNLNELIKKYPHVQNYFLDYYTQIACLDASQIPLFNDALQELSAYFETALNDSNMQKLLYSLMTYFSKNPNDLIKIISFLKKFEKAEDKNFVLKYLGQLIDNNHPVNESFFELCPSAFDCIKAKKPPYPLPQDLISWRNVQTERYQEFGIQPFGERNFQSNFNLRKYLSQKKLFKSGKSGFINELFTLELGYQLRNRLLILPAFKLDELEQELSILRKKQFPKDHTMELLTLVIEFLARTASQIDPTTGRMISQELNTTQVMALYAALMNDDVKMLDQFSTGEGKSRIIAVFFAVQALRGKTCDVMTSDMDLAERDYLDYRTFYAALNIPTSLITFNTPKELYGKSGCVNISDNITLPLLRNQSDYQSDPYAYLDESEEARCLGLDEVDKFIGSSDPFNFSAATEEKSQLMWIYPSLVDFLEINPLTAARDMDDQVEKFLEYIKRIHHDPKRRVQIAQLEEPTGKEQIRVWLTITAEAMLKKPDVDYLVTEDTAGQLCSMIDEYGQTQYGRKIIVTSSSIIQKGATFAHGMQQILAVIENRKIPKSKFRFLSQPEAEIQRSTLAISFLDQYKQGKIYGISGTTGAEAPLADPEINQENYTYTIIPREKKSRLDDLPPILAKGAEKQISMLKSVIDDAQKNKQPVLIFCKNDAELNRFIKELSKFKFDPPLAKIDAATTTQELNRILKAAAQENQITLVTPRCARGVNINSDKLLTMTTYIPTLDDEIQMKGRSARNGRGGSYRMVLDITQEKINFRTHNARKAILEYQQAEKLTAIYSEKNANLFARFSEEIQKAFYADLKSKCEDGKKISPEDQQKLTQTWGQSLLDMNNQWNILRPKLLDLLKEGKEDAYIEAFNQFKQKCLANLQANLQLEMTPSEQEKEIAKTFSGAMIEFCV